VSEWPDGISDDWLKLWRNLSVEKDYRTLAPFYNLVIWDLAQEKIQIWLETKESSKDKPIIFSPYPDSDDEEDIMCGTIWKYSV